MPADAAASLRRRSDPKGMQRVRALVVDDDQNYATFVSVLTRRAGIQTDLAADGVEAIELIRSGRHYDLFLIDYEMPRCNGLELIRLIRSEAAVASSLAIMLTGRGELETKIAALTDGFDDFLVKAATELELVAKIAASKRLVMRQQTVDATLRELRGLASTDELTGLLNRRFFLEEAERILSSAGDVSLVLFDLDRFKEINDSFGHLAGDQVLRDVADVLKQGIRYEDFVVRFGGDEFVMMTSDLTLAELEEIVRRVSSRIEALQWTSAARNFTVGVSAGIATTRLLNDRGIKALLDAADRDLYKNKFVKRAPGHPATYDYGRNADGELVEFPSRIESDEEGRVEGSDSNG